MEIQNFFNSFLYGISRGNTDPKHFWMVSNISVYNQTYADLEDIQFNAVKNKVDRFAEWFFIYKNSDVGKLVNAGDFTTTNYKGVGCITSSFNIVDNEFQICNPTTKIISTTKFVFAKIFLKTPYVFALNFNAEWVGTSTIGTLYFDCEPVVAKGVL